MPGETSRIKGAVPERFSRTALILGAEGVERLSRARVAVFGAGGVGGYAIEALARSGIGTLGIIDNDRVSESNINRQIIASEKTVGQFKADAAMERVLDINPGIKVNVHKLFYMPDTSDQIDISCYDYVLDAIDTVTGKIEIILRAKEAGVPVISSMGAGNKLDASLFRVADIYETSVCPLARVMRRELKKRGIKELKVVYSEEKPLNPGGKPGDRTENVPGSVAFVPSVAGLIMAGEAVKDLIKPLNI